MAITTENISKRANFLTEIVSVQLGATAVSQTGTVVLSQTIPFPFQVISIEVYAMTYTATGSIDVAVGATSVLNAPITPIAATKVAGVLSATGANTRATAASNVLNVKYTTNGTGVIGGGTVTILIRPYGAKGDATPMLGESA